MARTADKYLVHVTFKRQARRKVKHLREEATSRKEASNKAKVYKGREDVAAVIVENVTRGQTHVEQWYAPGVVKL